jgi:hypothetical protein
VHRAQGIKCCKQPIKNEILGPGRVDEGDKISSPLVTMATMERVRHHSASIAQFG